jgi:hypothetical protein
LRRRSQEAAPRLSAHILIKPWSGCLLARPAPRHVTRQFDDTYVAPACLADTVSIS